MSNVALSELVVAHTAYHARMAAAFAAAGELEKCASEALLAWSILAIHGGEHAADSVAADLPSVRVGVGVAQQQAAVRRHAQALALDLQGHFVSEGQFDAAALYEALGSALGEQPSV